MNNTNQSYKFGSDGSGGHTLTEVGIVPPGGDGEVTKVKFGTAIKISPDEPVWVALGRRIVELEAQLTGKSHEFVRMENAWRLEVEKLEREARCLMVELNRSRK